MISKDSRYTPVFFPAPEDFRAWLEANHASCTEIIVGFYKTKSGRPSITWPQSVDEALCFGWIDGIRRSIDGDSYCIRFTPRKPTSTWSRINIARVEELTRTGRMMPVGLRAFEARKVERSGVYTYENQPRTLAPDYEKQFRRNCKAWTWFTT